MSTQRWRIVHEPWRDPGARYFAEWFIPKNDCFHAVEAFATQEQAERYIEARLGSDYGTSTVVKEYGGPT